MHKLLFPTNYSLAVVLPTEIRAYLKALQEFLNQSRLRVIGPRVRFIKTLARNTQQLREISPHRLEIS